ncbi:hypothetical protein [Streptomyces kronopolitis]|uniref:hypothetical protein n=1 Tax=Streptomyces kronopolitis TaxID=1612435 RepID=UPI0036B7F95C
MQQNECQQYLGRSCTQAEWQDMVRRAIQNPTDSFARWNADVYWLSTGTSQLDGMIVILNHQNINASTAFFTNYAYYQRQAAGGAGIPTGGGGATCGSGPVGAKGTAKSNLPQKPNAAKGSAAAAKKPATSRALPPRLSKGKAATDEPFYPKGLSSATPQEDNTYVYAVMNNGNMTAFNKTQATGSFTDDTAGADCNTATITTHPGTGTPNTIYGVTIDGKLRDRANMTVPWADTGTAPGGAQLVGKPAVEDIVKSSSTVEAVWAIGTDGNLYQRSATYTNGHRGDFSWENYTLPGGVKIVNDPSLNDRLPSGTPRQIFVTGNDGNVWRLDNQSGSWQWTKIGGSDDGHPFVTAPTVSSKYGVYAVDSNGDLERTPLQGGGFKLAPAGTGLSADINPTTTNADPGSGAVGVVGGSSVPRNDYFYNDTGCVSFGPALAPIVSGLALGWNDPRGEEYVVDSMGNLDFPYQHEGWAHS